MRSKAPLALMEQVIMVLVFALAAALCLRCFVWADQRSRRDEARDRALIEAQSMAEIVKSAGGDLDAAARRYGGEHAGANWVLSFDEDWERDEADPAYLVQAVPQDTGDPLLGKALIVASGASTEDVLCVLSVAWQEVDGNG